MSQCSTSCARAGIQPAVTSMAPINYLHLLSDRAGSERGNTLKPGGMACLDTFPHTHAGRLPGSSLSHFMSTQVSQSVFQTLHRVVSVPCKCFRQAKISATCHSHTHCYQLQKGLDRPCKGAKSTVTCPVGLWGR